MTKDSFDLNKILKTLNESQTRIVYYGIRDGVDISIYAKPEYDAEQMDCIYCGLRKGLDIKQYADPKISAEQMNLIYKQLKDDYCNRLQNTVS